MTTRRLLSAAALLAAVSCAPKAEPVSIEESGTLEEGDSLYEEDESYYDEFTIEAARGMNITIELESDDFDAFLMLFGPGGSMVDVDDDSDPDGGTDARIETEAPSSGTYKIFANSLWAPGECPPLPDGSRSCEFEGAYTIRITTSH